ncbi:MAG: HelD family protein [Candidatus Caccovivens sp.]
MDKKILFEEKQYLETVENKIKQLKDSSHKKIKSNNDSIANLKKYFTNYFYEIKTGADELADINTSIEHFEQSNLNLKNDIERLNKQMSIPYFGRFDFKSTEDNSPKNYYIGLGLIQDEDKNNFVYDWRADICSLYYDDKIGKTSYECPDGQIKGEVSLKRQYKIENGELSYYIDSTMIIDDDILMEQLSKNSTSKMHEIVSTIQKEQNVLIRADDFSNTIVQGVAGSGKTSIAMHRVSYLLYKYRNTLKSEDILVLSPSELFGEYINEVLPSLGEEKSYTTTFSNMAKRLLGMEFESREKMLERVISKQQQSDFENIAIKSSFEFLDELKNFLNNDICKLFIPRTMSFGKVVISQEDMHDIFFNKLKSLPVYKRIDVLAEQIVEKFSIPQSAHDDLMKRAKELLYNNFLTIDLLKIYNIFLRSIDIDEVSSIGAYDIAPMLLIKENLFSLSNVFDAKYVIVDEMQDYTPCHFYLFDKIWSCGKLYLGDIYQSIDRTLTSDYLTLLAKLTHSKIKVLNKSYRSTLNISKFSQKILGKQIANNVNRNGEEVECLRTKSCADMIEKIVNQPKHKQQSIAIICKSKDEIKRLQKESSVLKKFKVIDDTNSLSKKVLTTPAMAKGVEFDCVIVPFANSENYSNELDRNLLYVASTRALHKLYFVSDKNPSKFLMKRKK